MTAKNNCEFHGVSLSIRLAIYKSLADSASWRTILLQHLSILKVGVTVHTFFEHRNHLLPLSGRDATALLC